MRATPVIASRTFVLIAFEAKNSTSRAKQLKPSSSRPPYQNIRRRRNECAGHLAKRDEVERSEAPKRRTLFFKDITYSAHCMNQTRPVVHFKLIAQIADIDFQHV